MDNNINVEKYINENMQNNNINKDDIISNYLIYIIIFIIIICCIIIFILFIYNGTKNETGTKIENGTIIIDNSGKGSIDQIIRIVRPVDSTYPLVNTITIQEILENSFKLDSAIPINSIVIKDSDNNLINPISAYNLKPGQQMYDDYDPKEIYTSPIAAIILIIPPTKISSVTIKASDINGKDLNKFEIIFSNSNIGRYYLYKLSNTETQTIIHHIPGLNNQ